MTFEVFDLKKSFLNLVFIVANFQPCLLHYFLFI